jgi:phosphoglycerol transferase
MGYKIAFLNPWRNAAENQAFNSLRIAAERLGHLLVHCSNSMEIEERDPDFVLATASTQAKLTRHPTFGVVHEGRQRFLLNREYFTNLLTYDGYLTISDSIRRFLENVLIGVGRQCEIGFYYNVPHRLTVSAPVQQLAAEHRLKLTYFGSNWDKRQWELFQRLDREGLLEIYGPPAAWAYLSGGSYRGALPFDGEAPQRTYARNGAGLVLLSEQHLRDDVISNRIFEIASVGAIAVACDTPWLRKHFGDSLYYFNQHDTPDHITERLREILFEIHEDPTTTADRAHRAREIFESQFSAEVLLHRAVQYFEAWKRPRTAPDRRTHPDVSVIIRCGGRSLSMLGRVLGNLRDQTYGRVTAILVMWRDFDPVELERFVTGGLVNLRVVKCLGGDRSATLTAGLQAIETAHFAILDDDDAWLPTHLERVFEVYRSSPSTRLVITGVLQETSTVFSIFGGGEERRRVYHFGFPTKASTAWEITSAFASNAFVAETALLDWRLLANPKMATAEDSHLVLGLAAKAPPRFNYAATAVAYQSEDGSGFLQHPQRYEDELTLFTRRLCELDQLIGPDETWHLLNTCFIRAQCTETSEYKNRIFYRVLRNAIRFLQRKNLHQRIRSITPRSVWNFLRNANRAWNALSRSA